MAGLAAIGRGTGRILKIVLFSLLFAVVALVLFGGIALGIRELAQVRQPDALPPQARPVFGNADELLFAAASAGAGCDEIAPFELGAGAPAGTTGISCLSAASRIWMLVFDSAEDRGTALTDGTVDAALCAAAGGPGLSVVVAGNWVYAVAGDEAVTELAAEVLDVRRASPAIVCGG